MKAPCWTQPSLLAFGLIVRGGACAAPSADRSQSHSPPDPHAVGTYEFALCNGRCSMDDSGAAIFRGILVLDSVPVAVPDSQRVYFQVATPMSVMVGADDRPAGCFAIHETTKPVKWLHGAPVVRGILAVGLTHWRYSPATGLTFQFYGSPDAALSVNATISGGRLLGRVEWSAEGVAEFQHEGDLGVTYISGQRFAPPDPTRCFRLAPGHWALDSLR
jgi:hypothetical protein